MRFLVSLLREYSVVNIPLRMQVRESVRTLEYAGYAWKIDDAEVYTLKVRVENVNV